MRAFTVSAAGGTPCITDRLTTARVAGGYAIVLRDSTRPGERTIISVAGNAGGVEDGSLVVERASITKIDGAHKVIAERRDDRKRRTQDALVFIDAAEVGRQQHCPRREDRLVVTVEERKFFRRTVTEISQGLCPTCQRVLGDDGTHPVLDAPLPGTDEHGVLTLAGSDSSSAGRVLIRLRPDANIAVFDGAVTWDLSWDGKVLALEEG